MPGLIGFADESSAKRGDLQVYMVGAAIVEADLAEDLREALRPLLLPGQIKVHWTDESRTRQRRIVEQIVKLGSMNVVVSHLDVPARKTERYRRKVLETLYAELCSMGVFELTLECRSKGQDSKDVAHLVSLRPHHPGSRIRLSHARGGDDPLLWVADAVLGALNAAHHGDGELLDGLKDTIVLQQMTPDSLSP